MSGFVATLRRIGADLDAIGVDHALVGGLAVSVRTQPRFTRDVDLAVALVDDAVAEAVIGELLQRGYQSLAMVEHEATGRLATARLTSPVGDGTVVDRADEVGRVQVVRVHGIPHLDATLCACVRRLRWMLMWQRRSNGCAGRRASASARRSTG